MTHFPNPSGLEVIALNILSAFPGTVAVRLRLRQRGKHIQNTIIIQIEGIDDLYDRYNFALTSPVVK